MCVGTMVVTRAQPHQSRKRTVGAHSHQARERTGAQSHHGRVRCTPHGNTQCVPSACGIHTRTDCENVLVVYMCAIYHNPRVLRCATFLHFRPNCQRTECTNLHGCFVHCPRSQARHILTPLGRFVVPRTIRLGHSHPPLGRSSPVECSPIGRPIGRPKHRGPRSGSANLAAASSAPYRPEQSWQS